ncbi:hypothetical protein [Aerosakkonema funiforme]|uniref:Uncharacterized protein n=1 Tax=Aerosakkonema funiforme FACHB-1375 TaxID=2949571 RepID=A0A926VM12_9CYAN|nr:hypothetical protein [Aerosakkonema funiforme]MBD2186184.1 hypothetical protein [Aerosakkonema funiforme FACHB-1375]
MYLITEGTAVSSVEIQLILRGQVILPAPFKFRIYINKLYQILPVAIALLHSTSNTWY